MVTNALNVAARLAEFPAIDLVVLGGVLRRDEMSLLGHLTVSALAELQIDKAFTGAFGLDAESGLSGMNLGETQTDRALIGAAARLVVLADGSKLSQRGVVRLAPSAISTLVTDARPRRGATAFSGRRGGDHVLIETSSRGRRGRGVGVPAFNAITLEHAEAIVRAPNVRRPR